MSQHPIYFILEILLLCYLKDTFGKIIHFCDIYCTLCNFFSRKKKFIFYVNYEQKGTIKGSKKSKLRVQKFEKSRDLSMSFLYETFYF